ncbi:16S rRNA (guanine(966)-N(2))-methyltransferase RsmD [Pontibacillus litoralis]|uniref:rRNA methyltransferase n=1 Tax=Pontibacillus litoralis JSM 072002 TaxID=1385512 RepID=A0A0A5GBJ5_9BACI|nr:16S rRNA (guanine(966)-N(2))-methyltransferase RsmD [Pontibacillus litoralis]KGX88563.1 rRNA methyltransferase [Pontibacillus litoralis JSM 072002]
MRVISGEFKGRKLIPVPHKHTRPTTDKVKESLFQMIGPYFEGGICLDLFAGSGGLGIESLSRGVDQGIFVDKHPKAIATIYENVKSLRIEDRVEVYRTDAFRALKAAAKRGLQFNYIFLDPPYDKISFEDLFEFIDANELLTEDGVLVCEHSVDQMLSEQIGPFKQQRSETYSSIITVSLYTY